jgi:hypothetical protein
VDRDARSCELTDEGVLPREQVADLIPELGSISTPSAADEDLLRAAASKTLDEKKNRLQPFPSLERGRALPSCS